MGRTGPPQPGAVHKAQSRPAYPHPTGAQVQNKDGVPRNQAGSRRDTATACTALNARANSLRQQRTLPSLGINQSRRCCLIGKLTTGRVGVNLKVEV